MKQIREKEREAMDMWKNRNRTVASDSLESNGIIVIVNRDG